MVDMIIYKVTHLKTGLIYIGQDKYNRPSYLGSGVIIRKLVAKYPSEDFHKEILQHCLNQQDMDNAERYWIKAYNSQDRSIGFNIASGGFGGDTISNHPNKDDIVARQAESLRGRKQPKAEILKRKESILNRPPDKIKKWKLRLSKASSERDHTWGDKISKALTGISISESSKQKIRDWHKTDAALLMYAKMSKSKKGKPLSEANRQAIIEAHANQTPEEKAERYAQYTKWCKDNPEKVNELNEKRSASLTGQTKSIKHRKTMSTSVLIDDQEFISFRKAAGFFNISAHTVERRCCSEKFPTWIALGPQKTDPVIINGQEFANAWSATNELSIRGDTIFRRCKSKKFPNYQFVNKDYAET